MESGLLRSFEQNLPVSPRIATPVLPFFRFGIEIVAAVDLCEFCNHHVLFTGIGKQAYIIQLNINLGLAGIYRRLVPGPAFEIMVGTEKIIAS